MSSELSMIEIAVSEFIANTCVVYPRPNVNRVVGLSRLFDRSKRNGIDIMNITVPTLTGSASEFFIEPMLRCVNDIDIMYYTSDMLVVPTRHHVTRYVQLPVEFHSSDEIKVYEFVDIQIPCYVFIRFIGKFRKCDTDDIYMFEPTASRYGYTERNVPRTQRGPANTEQNANTITEGPSLTSAYSLDKVQCIRCLEWPPQAADWPTRVRRYSFPDTATIQRIVDCGSDLVNATHRRYKHDDLVIRRRMHRISFSRAETLLLNSWTPKQQLIYHLLRYVVKMSGFNEHSVDDSMTQSEQSMTGIFHNYHLKTMMLLSCEQRSPHWWSLSLVRFITELLHVLSLSLSHGELQHYFITDCNLLDYLSEYNSLTVEFVISNMATVTDESLSVWLVDNYVRECAQRCPDHVSSLMNKINTTTELQHALSSIIDYRVSNTKEQSANMFAYLPFECSNTIWQTDLAHSHIYPNFIKGLRLVDRRLVEFCIALTFLHFTKLFRQQQDNLKVSEVVYKLLECEDSGNNLITRSRSNSLQSFFTLGTNVLMKLKTAIWSDEMLLIELTKVFFTESIINCNRNNQQNVQCLAHVILASLYYRNEQFQSAINQCLLVTKPCHAQCSSHVVDIRHLLNINDDISVVSGLIAVYQFIIQTRLLTQCQQTRHIGVVAAESCSFFLTLKCLICLKQVDRRLLKNILECYILSLRTNQNLFICDILLAVWSTLKTRAVTCKVVIYTRRSLSRKTETQPRVNTVRLRCLLTKSAVDRLTRVRQAMSRDYSSVTTIVTTDYEAMYAYKCGEYEKCLKLCEQNVRKLQFVNKMMAVCRVPASDLLLLMDDDLLSLVGLTVALLERVECENSAAVDQLTVSLYLLVQCKLQLRHSMTSLATVLRLVLSTHRRFPHELIVDRLILSFVYRKGRRALQRYTTRRYQLE